MAEAFCFLLIAVMLFYGWRLDNGFSLVLSPFIIFSIYFIMRTVPGFYFGVQDRYDVSNLYLLILPIAYGAFFFAYYMGGSKPVNQLIEYRASLKNISRWQFEKPIFFFMLVIFISGMGLYKGVPPAIGVAVNVANNSIDAKEAAGIVSVARQGISKEHVFNNESQGSGVFREIIFSSALLLLALASVYLFSSFGVRSVLFFILSILLAYVFVSGDGTRGRFVVVFTVVMIIFTVLKKVRLSHIALGIVVIFLVPIFLGAYTNKMASMFESGEWFEIARAVSERIFVGNSVNDATAISAIESGFVKMGYGYWLLRDFFAVIPGMNFDKPLAYYLYLYEIGGTATTYLTGTLISRAFADGGIIGTFLYFFVLGYISRRSHYLIKLFPSLSANEKIALISTTWLAAGQGYVSGLAGVVFMLGMMVFLMYFYGLTNVKFKK